MIELNEDQILYVERTLEDQGLKHSPLKEELLDHICCQVEAGMNDGMLFQEALHQSISAFEEDEIKNIQHQLYSTSNQTTSTMIKLSLSILSVLFFLVFQVDKTDMMNNDLSIEEGSVSDYSEEMFLDPPTRSPLKGDRKITSTFGMRMHPILKEKKHHRGIDFKAAIGTPVYATAHGVVKKVENTPKGYGKHIVIQHDNHYETLYAQLSEMDVKEGDEVQFGDRIGAVGSSGMSTAPHLHYEVIKDGARVDPEKYLRP